jgi:hypothetical protein
VTAVLFTAEVMVTCLITVASWQILSSPGVDAA